MESLYLSTEDAFVSWHETPGTDPAVVCLPGLCLPAVGSFLDVATDPALAGRRFVMIDFLGSGASDRPAGFDHALARHAAVVAAVLDHLGGGPFPVVGHSMGGTVAIALACARPDLVSRLVVGEANVLPGGGAASRRIAADPDARFAAEGLPRMLAALREGALAGGGFEGFVFGAWSQADPWALHAISRALVDLPEAFEEDFLALRIPRTFVYGEADAPDPARLEARGVQVAVLPGVGHELMIGAPAAFAGLLAGLLD